MKQDIKEVTLYVIAAVLIMAIPIIAKVILDPVF
jgi:hypothetical protein